MVSYAKDERRVALAKVLVPLLERSGPEGAGGYGGTFQVHVPSETAEQLGGLDLIRAALRKAARELGFARPGDRINVLTLDRLGRNMRETLNLVHDLTERGIFLRTLGDKLAVDTSEPGPGTDMAIALLAMFAQMERIYMLERAAGARAAKEARGLPTGRPAKLNATTRAGAAQRIKDGAIPEQVAAELGVSRSTLYQELRKHREGAAVEPVGQEG